MTEYYGICLVIAVTAVAIYALMNFGTFAILKGIEWYKRTKNKESEKVVNNAIAKLAEVANEMIEKVKEKRKQGNLQSVKMEDIRKEWDDSDEDILI